MFGSQPEPSRQAPRPLADNGDELPPALSDIDFEPRIEPVLHFATAKDTRLAAHPAAARRKAADAWCCLIHTLIFSLVINKAGAEIG